jgi:hypothetical protein
MPKKPPPLPVDVELPNLLSFIQSKIETIAEEAGVSAE